MTHPEGRIFGLDLLRAVAVLLVIFHHSLFYLLTPACVFALGWSVKSESARSLS